MEKKKITMQKSKNISDLRLNSILEASLESVIKKFWLQLYIKI